VEYISNAYIKSPRCKLGENQCSGDDLEQIEKLVLMLRSVKAKFYLTEQARDEFNRNRANKIADALKEFRREKLDLKFPQITKHYEEYSGIFSVFKKLLIHLFKTKQSVVLLRHKTTYI
jgi:hypothetical protein